MNSAEWLPGDYQFSPSLISEYPSTSVTLGLGTLMSPVKAASLTALITLSSAFMTPILGSAASLGFNTQQTAISHAGSAVYNGSRGVVPMTRRRVVSQVRGLARTIARTSRYDVLIVEDHKRVIHPERVITQTMGHARTVEHKSRWSAE